jgi:hypothetical protein
LFFQESTQISDFLSENKRSYPFILALGSPELLQFSSFYVIFGKKAAYCTGPSFLKALDLGFKFFSVFYYPFPMESGNFWYFIVHGVSGKPTSTSDMPPVVQALLGQIMPKI